MATDVLVVDPPRRASNQLTAFIGAGCHVTPINTSPLQLATQLLLAGLSVSYLPLYGMFPEYSPVLHRDHVVELLRSHRAKLLLVMTSMYNAGVATPTFLTSLDIIETYKQLHPRARIALGGAHASALVDEQGTDLPAVDAVLTHDCELCVGAAVRELLSGGSNTDPRKPVLVSPGSWLGDLDCLAVPNYSLIVPFLDLVSLYQGGVPVAVRTSRGCSRNCAFCSTSMRRRRPSFRGREMVCRDLQHLTSVLGDKARFLSINDDSFTQNPAHAIEMSRLLHDLGITFETCLSNVGDLSTELAQELARGVREVFLGVESFVPQVLKSMGKFHTLEQVVGACVVARRAGLRTRVNMIAGLPGEDIQSVAFNVRVCVYLKALDLATDIVSNPLLPYPGSLLGVSPTKYGVEIVHRDWDQYDIRGCYPPGRIKGLTRNQVYDYTMLLHVANHWTPTIDEGWRWPARKVCNVIEGEENASVTREVARFLTTVEEQRALDVGSGNVVNRPR